MNRPEPIELENNLGPDAVTREINRVPWMAYDVDEMDLYIAAKDAEIRRLRRALWRAIALFCARSCEYFNGIMSHCLMGQDDLYKRCEKKKNKYLNSMNKCRAKAEKYGEV